MRYQMCGIIGIISNRDVAPLLIDGLKRLEYRGYDSAGVATLVNGHVERRRTEGKIVNLQSALDGDPLSGTIGIGHTRWATHGLPNTTNAHPHADGKVVLVHNGIIENHGEIRSRLRKRGYKITSETDSELIAHLIHFYKQNSDNVLGALIKATGDLKGAYSIAAIDNQNKGIVYLSLIHI